MIQLLFMNFVWSVRGRRVSTQTGSIDLKLEYKEFLFLFLLMSLGGLQSGDLMFWLQLCSSLMIICGTNVVAEDHTLCRLMI